MRANIHTELSPTVGSEQQGEELIKSLLSDFETDPGKLWSTNIFGKSLNELVSEGVQAKLLHMPQEARARLQQTLERIINEGCDGGVMFRRITRAERERRAAKAELDSTMQAMRAVDSAFREAQDPFSIEQLTYQHAALMCRCRALLRLLRADREDP